MDLYADKAVEVLMDMLERESAVVWPEVEAKAADAPWGGAGTVTLNPHRLTTARRELIRAGLVGSEVTRTRGGRRVETFHLLGTPDRRWKPVAARKRLLQARYLSWASGTKRHPRGFLGPGMEGVVRRSLREAAGPAGYFIENPGGRDVSTFLGTRVAGGPLDAAAHLIVMRDGRPDGTAAVAIEVKNIRDWIYPTKQELFQLLDKAAKLQLANDDERVVPVLVCRRTHYTAAKMAKALGFYIIDLKRQYLPPSPEIDDADLHEVQTELGYRDLLKESGPDSLLVKHLTTSLPSVVERSAERWKQSAELLGESFEVLRRPNLDDVERADLMRELRVRAREIEGEEPGGW